MYIQYLFVDSNQAEQRNHGRVYVVDVASGSLRAISISIVCSFASVSGKMPDDKQANWRKL